MQNVSKRTILWIVPILIIAIFWYYYGPQEEITDNEYITYIKESTIENSSTTWGDAFAGACKDEKWVYFETQKNQNVVEYKAACEMDDSESNVNLQFVVEEEQQDYQVGVLLVEGEQQSKDQREAFLTELTSR